MSNSTYTYVDISKQVNSRGLDLHGWVETSEGEITYYYNIKQFNDDLKEIKNYQQKVFGFEGLYFLKKKELIQPIQDVLFESIEKVAKKNRLQIIFDKSSEPVLLYTNPIHDYTDYVLEDLGVTKKNN